VPGRKGKGGDVWGGRTGRGEREGKKEENLTSSCSFLSGDAAANTSIGAFEGFGR
jgi:hypothetical protein